MSRFRVCLLWPVWLLLVLAPPGTTGGAPGARKARVTPQSEPLPEGALVRLGPVRLRHARVINCLAFAPDGKTLVASDDEGAICFWDTATGRERSRIISTKGRLVSVAFTPDGKRVVGGIEDGRLNFWDVATGELLSRGERYRHSFHFLKYSPDGKVLATGDGDRDLWLYDAQGKALEKLAPCNLVAFAPRGTLLAVSGPGYVALRDRATGKEIRRFAPDADLNPIQGIWHVAFSADGKTLVCAGKGVDATLEVWDAVTGARKAARGFDTYKPMALSPDGRLLVLANGAGLLVWDTAADRQAWKAPLTEGAVRHLAAFSPDGKLLASASGYGLDLWDAQTGRKWIGPCLHRYRPECVVLSSDGRTAAAGVGAEVAVWDTATGKERFQFPAEGGIRCLACSADGKALAVAANRLTLWDLTSGQARWRRPGEFSHLALSPDGKVVAAANREAVVLWSAATGEHLRRWAAPPEGLAALAFSPGGKRLLAVEGGAKATTRIWDADSGKEIARWTPAQAGGLRLFGPGGSALALGQGEKLRVAVLDRATGKPLLELLPRTNAGEFYALSPDGRMLAAAAKQSPSLWLSELTTGRLFCRFEAQWPDGPVRPLAFSPDGKRLLTEASDGRLLLWDLAPRGRAGGAAAGQTPERLWDALAGHDGKAAYRAMWALAEAGPRTVTFLQARLRPVRDDSQAWLRRLVAELDDKKFAVREAAAKKLRALGPKVAPYLRRALAANPPLEVRKRLESILAALPPAGPQDGPPDALLGEPLRTVRAIQVLEWIGTPEARAVLRSLAGGESSAQETRHAKVSLELLDRRPVTP
jgi:WD40 repeat protein